MTNEEISIQRIHRDRRRDNFVGRVAEIDAFRRNLALPLNQRKYIWTIHGQGGIGKTSLLKQYLSLSRNEEALTGISDEAQTNLLEVMGAIAGQLKEQGYELSTFAERYHKYLELKQQVESDPNLPAGASSMIGRALGKASVSLMRQIPVAGIAIDFLGEDNLIDKASELGNYFARRFSNKDEVRLILEPINLLTPIFLKDLSKISISKQVVIGFDTFEKTGSILNVWLRNILEGEYGNLSAAVLIIMAGRDQLGNEWTEYLDLINSISLEVLPEAEARSFLSARGVSDADTIDVILTLSGRIPLWLATLASQVRNNLLDLSDPTDEAIDRFLKWIHEEDQRKAAVLCALPAELDRDVMSVLLGNEKSGQLFDWLKKQPFMQKRLKGGWVYHEVVRRMMLRHMHNESRTDWDNLHKTLAAFFLERRDGLAMAPSEAFTNMDWLRFDLAYLYHSICGELQSGIRILAEKFISAVPRELDYATRIGETAKEAGIDLENQSVIEWGEQCIQCIAVYQTRHSKTEGLKFLDQIGKVLTSGSPKYIELLLEKARLHEFEGQYEAALIEIEKSIDLKLGDPSLLLRRAEILRQMDKNDAALADYSRAADLTPMSGESLIERAMFLNRLGRVDEALQDINTAISREPGNADFLESRARLHEDMKMSDRALVDYSKAIDIDPGNYWRWITRANSYKRLDDFEKALADYDHAFKIHPEDFILGWRGDLLFNIGKFEESLAEYLRAIEFRDRKEPKETPQLFKVGDLVRFIGAPDYEGRSGVVLEAMGKHDEALEQFSKAIDRESGEVRAFYLCRRADLLQKIQRFDEAADSRKEALMLYDTLIGVYERRSDLLTDRGMLSEKLGDEKKALSDYTAVIELTPNDFAGWLLRSNLLAQQGLYAEALSDFRRAYGLEKNKNEIWEKHFSRLLSYVGLYDEAFLSCEKALAIYPEDWQLACEVAVMKVRSNGVEAAKVDIQKAEAACEEALTTIHKAAAHYALARLMAIRLEHGEALKHLKDALSIECQIVKSAVSDVAFLDMRFNTQFQSLIGIG